MCSLNFRGYDHRVANRVLDGEFFAEALYECLPGFQFSPSDLRTLYCAEGEWTGRRPACIAETAPGEQRPPCSEADSAFCEQLCFLDAGSGAPVCGCHEGYTLREDERTCADVDECEDGSNGGCDHGKGESKPIRRRIWNLDLEGPQNHGENEARVHSQCSI